jgi:hypothetical protein
MSDWSLKTKVAFYTWLALLLISLSTFAVGFSGHVVTLLAAPWLCLKTQAVIHTAISAVMTAVKFVTVPLLLMLTPFARHHPTFEGWTDWGKARFRELEAIAKAPFALARLQFYHVKSLFSRRGPGQKSEEAV